MLISFFFKDDGKIYCQFHKSMKLPDPVILLIVQTNFYFVTCLQHIKLHHGLLRALIKRWTYKTHSFHL
jgi:hypothetical protein